MNRRTWAAPAASLLAILASLYLPFAVAAHPLGNFTVNRAVVIEIGASVEIRYLIDMAEIPAFEAIRRIDTNGDGTVGSDEAEAEAGAACAEALATIAVRLDGDAVGLEEAASPALTFPPGAGGLETLRLECRFALNAPIGDTDAHRLEVTDGTDDGRLGWREVTARAHGSATISDSDVPDVSGSAELTAYPEDALQTPPDVRAATLTFRLGDRAGASPTPPPSALAPTPGGGSSDPLAALVAGELSPPIVVLAMLVALGLGAVHALSPGHGKTLVAAYVLGAGGDARSAMLIGLSVAVSHTAGVFALGVLTLAASELFLPERVIGWLSLVSGIVVAGLGLVLLSRQWPRIRHLTRGHRHAEPAPLPHGHDGEHGEDHEHVGDHHEHDHSHGHTHAVPTGTLTWRSALALGFAGGAVPSASALIVLLVAISSDRLAFGSVLISMFGIGMAVVLGGLGLLIARAGRVASAADGGWLSSPVVRRVAQWVPLAASLVVLVTGIAFALAAAGQLS